ncbi:MAG: hypothetical protein AVDCRST_MAG89-4600 [uncultured Gemmatimonadetes bacterium]|jgi:hypothetical protein|uniref:Uncharacterized protein n=1 Tax=uncultured Gemmatimonadota bacterium TaxID=203437 RepID=A0A6J4MZV0_9BACT|nr:MAG: hypothetical protein AVDCRST_MAG89-4600 [uncultured Gemmatimonadota bacterium]
MLIQEVLTELTPAEVIDRAREFFNMRFSPYGGFTESAGPTHITFHVEAGEVAIGVGTQEGRTLVRASTSRLHHEVSQFLITIAPPEEVRQNVPGPGASGAG